MDLPRFQQSRQLVLEGHLRPANAPASIGVLGEKTVHAVIKHYMEPNTAHHELRVGSFVVDCLSHGVITEIQTGHFRSIGKKLETLLTDYRVNLVCPIPRKKWICWTDPQTGEVGKGHKSPKCGAPIDLCYELYWIRSLLSHPNLHLCILLLDMEEHRLQNGWGNGGKRGSTRLNRIPLALAGELWLEKPTDYLALLPQGLPRPFTGRDLQKAARLSEKGAERALRVLRELQVVAPLSKRGNAYLYHICGEASRSAETLSPL